MTANPHLKRTYSWKIEKSVSQAAVTLAPGATADVTYTVVATPTGSVDSDWGVSGHVSMQEECSPAGSGPRGQTVNVTIKAGRLPVPPVRAFLRRSRSTSTRTVSTATTPPPLPTPTARATRTCGQRR